MSGIELTTSQKVQIAFVTLVLGIAGYEMIHGMRPGPDMNVASWTEARAVGNDPGKPITVKNPTDPTKSGTATILSSYDGTLEIAEYPEASNKGIEIRFKPDTRRAAYQIYKDPVAAITAIKDPYMRAMTMAAYSASWNRPLGLLGSAGMTKDQLTAEKAARDLMMSEVLVYDQEAHAGAIAPALHKELSVALAAFRKTPGDAMKDRTKALAARKVITAALAYMAAVQNKRMAAVNKYVAAVDKGMLKEQKPKITAALTPAMVNKFKNAIGPTAVVAAPVLTKS